MRRNKVAKRYRTAKDREAAMADFIIAYEKCLGVLKPACEMTGMCRKTIWEWRKKYPEFDDACHECEEVALDFVESNMFKKIDKLGLAMIEQPLFHADVIDHAKLQAAIACYI